MNGGGQSPKIAFHQTKSDIELNVKVDDGEHEREGGVVFNKSDQPQPTHDKAGQFNEIVVNGVT